MKLSEVEVGGRYTAKVSGNVVVVLVVEIEEIPRAAKSRISKARTRIHAVNESTARRITIRLAQRLRRRVEAEAMREMHFQVACSHLVHTVTTRKRKTYVQRCSLAAYQEVARFVQEASRRRRNDGRVAGRAGRPQHAGVRGAGVPEETTIE